MALETPNAIAAAAVVQFDAAQALGSMWSLASSNGMGEKLGEFLFAGGNPAVGFAFQNPITAFEACLSWTVVGFGPGVEQWFTIAQIKGGPVGDPDYDALPDGTLFMVNGEPPPPAAPILISVTVLRLPRG